MTTSNQSNELLNLMVEIIEDLNRYYSNAHREVVGIPSISYFVDIFILNLRYQSVKLRYTMMNQTHIVHIFVMFQALVKHKFTCIITNCDKIHEIKD